MSNLGDIQNQMTTIYGSLQKIEKANCGNDTIKELGQKAMDLIAEYPLYVSGESNITYAEAIGIAMFMYGDIEREWERAREVDKAMPLYLDYYENFDKANGEPVCFEEWFNNEYQEIKKGK